MNGTSTYRIAYVLTPITFGGAEKVNLNFLKNVDRETFDIEPIMFLRPWERENYFAEEIKRLQFTSCSIPVSHSINGELLRVPRCLMKLKEIIGTGHYDLVHTHGYLADLLGLPAATASGIPVMSTCHGFIRGGTKLSLYTRLDIFALGYFDRVIAVSDSIGSEWLKDKVRPERLRVIENCTSCPVSSASATNDKREIREIKRQIVGVGPGEILVGYTGRLSREKGVADLIGAVKMLAATDLPIRLVLVGDGAQRAELEELVAAHMLTDKVCFTGFQTDVENWLAAMDIFVLPSHTEGTPMSLLEAMASGVPSIATAVGGIPDVIDAGIDGVLVAPGNPGELCEALYSLGSDAETRALLSGNARQKIARKYDIKNWTAKIEGEYVDVLQTARGKMFCGYSTGE